MRKDFYDFCGYPTPLEVCDSIISLLEKEGFFDEPDSSVSTREYIESHRVLDLYCKSGNFLKACYYRFCRALASRFKTADELNYFIWRYLLFAVCPNYSIAKSLADELYTQVMLKNCVLGNLYIANSNENTKYYIPEELKSMKFDVVVGNPPYNNSIDVDFIRLAKQVSDTVVMITSASWYSRRNRDDSICDGLKYCKYFPMSYDIFEDVKQLDGLTICHWEKGYTGDTTVENYWSSFPVFNTTEKRSLKGVTPIINLGYHLVNSLGNFKSLEIKPSSTMTKKYCVKSTDAISGFADYSPNNSSAHYILPSLSICNNPSEITGHYKNLFESDDLAECESFKSYLETSPIRFLIMTGLYSLNSYTSHGFRFVPAPDKFDHIFTDAEVYNKFNIGSNYISIIGSVIKKR